MGVSPGPAGRPRWGRPVFWLKAPAGVTDTGGMTTQPPLSEIAFVQSRIAVFRRLEVQDHGSGDGVVHEIVLSALVDERRKLQRLLLELVGLG